MAALPLPPPSITRLGTQYGLIRASGGEKQRDGGTRFRKVAASAAASYHFFCQLIFRHGSEPVKRSVERGPRGLLTGAIQAPRPTKLEYRATILSSTGFRPTDQRCFVLLDAPPPSNWRGSFIFLLV